MTDQQDPDHQALWRGAGDRLDVLEVLQSAPVGLLVLDEQGIVRFAAGTALQIAPEDLIGRPWLAVADDDLQVALVDGALRGNPVDTVLHWRDRYWQLRSRPLGGVGTHMVLAITDVTTQVRTEQALAASAVRLQAALAAVQDAVLVLDPEQRIVIANERCSRLFGGPLPPGTLLQDILTGHDIEIVRQRLLRRKAGESERYEVSTSTAGGEPIWLLIAASPMFGGDGEFLGTTAVLTDITVTKLEQQRLATAAQVDTLTGVANRSTLADRLEHALSRRTAGVVAVLFCDVDDLKTVNDTFGHAAGDELLQHIAHRITAIMRPADSLARYGGDEFVLVCEDLHNQTEALALAERIRHAVAQPLTTTSGRIISPTLSIGVATSPPEGNIATLLGAADGAAYAAKRAGRNTVRLAA